MVVVPAGEFIMGSPENEKDRSFNEGLGSADKYPYRPSGFHGHRTAMPADRVEDLKRLESRQPHRGAKSRGQVLADVLPGGDVD
jgi:hypothetical protein